MSEISTNKTLAPDALKVVALQMADSQVGQKEEPLGSNKGPMVNVYLKSVGLKPGYPWCEAFVHWCFGEAAKLCKLQNPVVHTAGVIDCWNKTSSTKKLFQREIIARPELISPGDQIIMAMGKGTGHTGIVERVEGNMIHTIEGNTNDDGAREGYEVARRIRDVNTLFGVIRY